jgi:hypothetical protein
MPKWYGLQGLIIIIMTAFVSDVVAVSVALCCVWHCVDWLFHWQVGGGCMLCSTGCVASDSLAFDVWFG